MSWVCSAENCPADTIIKIRVKDSEGVSVTSYVLLSLAFVDFCLPVCDLSLTNITDPSRSQVKVVAAKKQTGKDGTITVTETQYMTQSIPDDEATTTARTPTPTGTSTGEGNEDEDDWSESGEVYDDNNSTPSSSPSGGGSGYLPDPDDDGDHGFNSTSMNATVSATPAMGLSSLAPTTASVYE